MITQQNELSTGELVELLENSNIKVIDIRPVEAYNGWKLNGETRGGHIKGAKSLPEKWTKYMDWIEIVHAKSILQQHKIVVYGYSRETVEKAVRQFQKAGYPDVNLYLHFMDEWTTNMSLPMEYLPRYSHLVSAEWVKTLLSGNRPQEYDNNKFVVVHAHYRNREAYLSGHIPPGPSTWIRWHWRLPKHGTVARPKSLKLHWSNTASLLTLR